MQRTVLIALGCGGLSVTALLAASTGPLMGSPLGVALAYLTPLPLLMVGLGLGPAPVAISGLAGVAAIAVVGGLQAAGVYGGMHALPSWLVTRQALSGRPALDGGPRVDYPFGAVLCWLTLLAGTISVLTVLSLSGQGSAEAAVRNLLEQAAVLAVPDLPPVDRETFVGYLAPLFIGMSGMAWLIMMVINATIAQSVLEKRGWNLRATPNWSSLTLPDWMSWLIVGAALIALAGNEDLVFVARNLLLVFGVPFFLLGLAVIHSIVPRTRARKVILAVFYVFLGLFLGLKGSFAGGVVVALGIVEQWVGIRRRFAGTIPVQRSE